MSAAIKAAEIIGTAHVGQEVYAITFADEAAVRHVLNGIMRVGGGCWERDGQGRTVLYVHRGQEPPAQPQPVQAQASTPPEPEPPSGGGSGTPGQGAGGGGQSGTRPRELEPTGLLCECPKCRRVQR